MKEQDDKIYLQDTSYDELEKLLKEHNKDPNSNYHGYTALHQAAALPNDLAKKRILLLLEYGINPNIQDMTGQYKNTPLHTLIANEQIEIAIFFIVAAKKYNIKINFNLVDAEGKTPLILAAKMAKEKFAIFMIENCTPLNFNQKDHNGFSTLHYACILGQLELVKLLLAKQATIDITNTKNKTPLDCLVFSKQETEEILKAVSIDPKRDENAVLNLFCDRNIQPLQNLPGFPLFNICAQKKNISHLINILPVSIMDSETYFINKKISRLSDKNQAYLNNILNEFSGRSILDKCLQERVKVMHCLLDYKADYSWLLRYYAANGDIDNLNYLLGRTTITHYINKKGEASGKTALHQAAWNGNLTVCIALLNKGALINAQDNELQTPLHLAILKKHALLIVKLMEYQPNINLKNKNEKTIHQLLEETSQVHLIARNFQEMQIAAENPHRKNFTL